MAMLWTDETSEEALRMWNDGYSATIIAKTIGTTRNAVLGKLFRMGAPKRGVTKATVQKQRVAPPAKKLRDPTFYRGGAQSRREIAAKFGFGQKHHFYDMERFGFTGRLHQKAISPKEEPTKNQLRKMLEEAMRNTASLVVATEAAE